MGASGDGQLSGALLSAKWIRIWKWKRLWVRIWFRIRDGHLGVAFERGWRWIVVAWLGNIRIAGVWVMGMGSELVHPHTFAQQPVLQRFGVGQFQRWILFERRLRRTVSLGAQPKPPAGRSLLQWIFGCAISGRARRRAIQFLAPFGFEF